jgi:tetratricopeptide (TPR) repeat protein
LFHSSFGGLAQLGERYVRNVQATGSIPVPSTRKTSGAAYAAPFFFIQQAANFSEAIRLDPGNADVYLNRGALLMDSGGLLAAVADFERALELSPGSPAALYYAGVALEKSGDRERGLSYLRQAASLGLPEARERLEGR